MKFGIEFIVFQNSISSYSYHETKIIVLYDRKFFLKSSSKHWFVLAKFLSRFSALSMAEILFLMKESKFQNGLQTFKKF